MQAGIYRDCLLETSYPRDATLDRGTECRKTSDLFLQMSHLCRSYQTLSPARCIGCGRAATIAGDNAYSLVKSVEETNKDERPVCDDISVIPETGLPAKWVIRKPKSRGESAWLGEAVWLEKHRDMLENRLTLTWIGRYEMALQNSIRFKPFTAA